MLTPDQIKKLYAKALAAQQAGRLSDAEKSYQRILKARPNVAEAQFNLGRVLAKKGAHAAAAPHFETALQLKPGQPEIWLAYLDMASTHPNTNNLDKLLKRAGSGLDKYPEVAFFKGLIAARKGDHSEARKLIEGALEQGLVSARAQTELGVILAATGETDAALASYERALDIQPEFDFALARKAELLRNIGQYDEAAQAARAAIDAAPRAGQLYYTYASIQKVQADDPMIAQMRRVLKAAPARDPGLAPLGHALAKSMEDIGHSEDMWRYLDIANAATARTFPYDYESDARQAEQIQALFTKLPDVAPSAQRNAVPCPIFVTGLPRSGTTLVEQILASHSQCEGAGEAALLGKALRPVLESRNDLGGELVQILEDAGQNYRTQLASRFPDVANVADKSISSYAQIGLIRYALPDAKIIVVRRDPGDNALSIYKNLFPGGTHRYAADLRTIAQFIRLFEAQLTFWRETVPSAFYEINYEDLIHAPEAQTRALIDAVGLPWEDACLSFYDSSRKVDTLSTTQVRQPIYASSVGAWKRYEAQMAPFWEAYGAD